VRLNAIIVAVLGIAGGFLTAILLSTNQDNPLGLFGYIALLDIGLLALAQRKRWECAGRSWARCGTALMQFGLGRRRSLLRRNISLETESSSLWQSLLGFSGRCFLGRGPPWAKRTGKKRNTTFFACAIGLAAGRDVLGILPAWFPCSRASAGAVCSLICSSSDVGLAGTNADRKKGSRLFKPWRDWRHSFYSAAWTGKLPDDRSHFIPRWDSISSSRCFHAAMPIAFTNVWPQGSRFRGGLTSFLRSPLLLVARYRYSDSLSFHCWSGRSY